MRKAAHAGSWYTENPKELDNELSGYMAAAKKFEIPEGSKIKGLIGPHAGFYFSGPTAGWGYINLDKNAYKRVFLLGPSHKAYLSGCALTKARFYETPFGNLEIDHEINAQLN